MSQNAIIKALLITAALQTGMIFSLVAGIASRIAGSAMPTAVGAGFGTFFVSITVALAIITFARS
ncbi:hypothetical protein [Actinomadura macra]|uniref:hypothetical protein n=1 Tax=Actinomadura macra TaxID=46164 RepID=UPI0008371A0E|nr:hypothetical protein [Actinomadura macra]